MPHTTSRWWKSTLENESLEIESIRKYCEKEGRGLIVRNFLDKEWLGWNGAIAEESTKEIITMYPGKNSEQTAFSRERCQADGAAIKPSLALFAFLEKGVHWPWQVRANLQNKDLARKVGIPTETLRLISVSLWGGGKNTRTPLHSDCMHAIIIQVAGSGPFLCNRQAVQDAVQRGTIPQAVLDYAATENFQVDGDQNHIFGLSAEEPTRIDGELANLHQGDALVLPAGLYHDVACANDEASLSLTVRFEFDDDDGKVNKFGSEEQQKLRRFLLKLALKKAAASHYQHHHESSNRQD